MSTRNVVITESDYHRLRLLVENCRKSPSRDAEHIESLEHELDRASIVKDGYMPSDVVTMNSRVRVRDLNTGREMTYQIVFPVNADVAKNRISVLAPIGTGLLGYRTGTTLEWSVPSGIRRFRILDVKSQPRMLGLAA